MKKQVTNREYRDSSEIQQRENYSVEGYATIFNKPYVLFEVEGRKYYEIIDRHAFDNTDLSDVIFQFDHAGKVYARTSNKTLEISIDEKGLFVKANLGSTESSKQMFEEIRSELVTKMSFGFIVSPNGDSYDSNTLTRTITSIKKLFDVSAVSIPANPDTEISARTYVDGVIEHEMRESQEHMKQKLILMTKL